MSAEKQTFLYGELNQKAVLNNYTGGSTNTASVYVDNTNGIIYANAKIDVEKVEEELAKANKNYLDFLDSKELIYTRLDNLESKVDTKFDDVYSLLLVIKDDVNLKVSELNAKINLVQTDLTKSIADNVKELNDKILATNAALEVLNIKVDKLDEDLTKKIDDTKKELEDYISKTGFSVVDGKLNVTYLV